MLKAKAHVAKEEEEKVMEAKAEAKAQQEAAKRKIAGKTKVQVVAAWRSAVVHIPRLGPKTPPEPSGTPRIMIFWF